MNNLFRILRAGLVVLGLSCVPALRVPAQTWTVTRAPITNWAAVACSADGSKVVAAANNGLIYRSIDGGGTWLPGSSPATNWLSLASSEDGTKLIAGSFGFHGEGFLYLSTNSGALWAPVISAGVGFWLAVAVSADGGLLAAGPGYGLILWSDDSGRTWTNVWLDRLPYDRITSIAFSADGSKCLVSLATRLAWTTNRGMSWTNEEVWSSTDYLTNCPAVTCSADGKKFVAVVKNLGVYRSADSGSTWAFTSLPVTNWTSVAGSADGTRLVAVATGGTIYSSTDSGATWTGTTVPDGQWSSVACSADGARMVAVMDGGGIYTWQATPTPRLNLAPSGTNLVLFWTVPSMNFVLEENADLTGTNWTQVPATPALNYSNLQNQVTVPAPAGTAFYRLVSR